MAVFVEDKNSVRTPAPPVGTLTSRTWREEGWETPGGHLTGKAFLAFQESQVSEHSPPLLMLFSMSTGTPQPCHASCHPHFWAWLWPSSFHDSPEECPDSDPKRPGALQPCGSQSWS